MSPYPSLRGIHDYSPLGTAAGRPYPHLEGRRGVGRLAWGESSPIHQPSLQVGGIPGYPALGMGKGHRDTPSLCPSRGVPGVSGTRHGEKALRQAVRIHQSKGRRAYWALGMEETAPPQAICMSHSEGLGSTKHSAWEEESAKGCPYPTLRGPRVHPALGMGRELHHGSSVSHIRRVSKVYGIGHGERAPPRAVPIRHTEALGYIPHRA